MIRVSEKSAKGLLHNLEQSKLIVDFILNGEVDKLSPKALRELSQVLYFNIEILKEVLEYS